MTGPHTAQPASFDITEVVQTSGIPASTIRYYEEVGLITSIGRRGLKRLFAPDVLERLALIALGQQAGFTLAELGEIMHDAPSAIDRDLLRVRATALDDQIRQLQFVRNLLWHTAACPAKRHVECPTFRRMMRIALWYQRRAKAKQSPAPLTANTP